MKTTSCHQTKHTRRKLFVRAMLLAGAAVASTCIPVAVVAQERPGVAPDYAAMYQHLQAAREIAGDDLYAHYVHRCIMDQTYRRTISRGLQARNTIEPVRVFNELYFVGQNAVSAWALDTGEGIILFDTLYSPEDVQNTLEPGLREFGLDPNDISYVVITHAHGDHYGGARYIKDRYGARILASTEDWAQMARTASGEAGAAPSNWADLVPEQDMDVTDGQQLTLGGNTLTFYITPGHTPGTVSTIFTVHDGVDEHRVGFFGGLGTPQTAEDKLTLIDSLERFKSIVDLHGLDVLIANHQTQDQSIPKLEELRLRHPGDSNPYVIGSDRFVRYLSIQQECTRFAMAQQGQTPD